MTTTAAAAAGAAVALCSKKSELVGTPVTASTTAQGLRLSDPTAILPSLPARRGLNVVASAGSKRKINVKNPFGPCGGTKFRQGADASGSKAKGKGVYQFSKKYGANVDGYSPIYVEEEWAPSGDVYAGGQAGLALWALTFAALLVAGALLVYNTSALA